jgi:hypothetical protein
MARSAALAGAIGIGVLCGVAVCEPARADVVAFENTLNPALPTQYYATLYLFDGSTSLIPGGVSTNKFQGYISNSDSSPIPSIGGPNGSNTSYAAGSYNGMLLIDYFGFNLNSLSPTQTITSAELVVNQGLITNDLTYTLFGASQWVTELVTPQDQNAALYQNLLNGASNAYGSFQLAANDCNPLDIKCLTTPLTFDLGGSALSDIEAAIANRQTFALAGQVSAVAPEPSTWVMMLAAFAGLGVVGRWRAAKRRSRPRRLSELA